MTPQQMNALRPKLDTDGNGIRITDTPATILPARLPLLLTQGAVLVLPVFWSFGGSGLIDLTGCTAKLCLRKGYELSPILTLTEGSGITLTAGADRGDPNVQVQVTAAQTAALGATSNFYSGPYDLEITMPGGTRRLLEGQATLRRRACA